MINIEVQEFKIKIGNEEYTFRLDFEALIKFERKYDDISTKAKHEDIYDENGLMVNESIEDTRNSIQILYDFLEGRNTYDCMMKILSCACVEKEWDEKELRSKIPFNFKTMKMFDNVTVALIEGMFDTEDTTEVEELEGEKEKN